MKSKANIILSLLCPSHDVIGDFVHLIVLIMQSLILKLQILELFVLAITIAFEGLTKVVHSFAYLFM